jgi:hypothetical protein
VSDRLRVLDLRCPNGCDDGAPYKRIETPDRGMVRLPAVVRAAWYRAGVTCATCGQPSLLSTEAEGV